MRAKTGTDWDLSMSPNTLPSSLAGGGFFFLSAFSGRSYYASCASFRPAHLRGDLFGAALGIALRRPDFIRIISCPRQRLPLPFLPAARPYPFPLLNFRARYFRLCEPFSLIAFTLRVGQQSCARFLAGTVPKVGKPHLRYRVNRAPAAASARPAPPAIW